MRVLVTGASGFVGSAVVRNLIQNGHETVALARAGSSFWRLEATLNEFRVIPTEGVSSSPILASLGDWRPEACIHLAWYVIPGQYLDSPENVESLALSLRLLEELADAGCGHVVMAGTCFEYDTDARVLKEDGPTRPATIYAACKLAACIIGARRAASLGMGFSWARLFYLYGPGEDQRRLVPAEINALLDGREFEAISGTQVRDYMHIDDVAGGLCALAETGASGTFNVCSSEPVTIKAIIEEVARHTGNADLVRLGARQDRGFDPPYICGDNSRLRAATGWAPRLSLADGLKQTVEWWRQRRALTATRQPG
jgi:nucleoside-diphosphate-sugar epimerase